MKISKFLLVNPATSAIGERAFSLARRVKTWLRAKMNQQKFNPVAILQTNKTIADNIYLVNVADEFA